MINIKSEIASALLQHVNLSKHDIEKLLEIPPKPEMGDYAFPCFQLAKTFKKSPNLIAEEIQNKIEKPAIISNISKLGGYVNFEVNKKVYTEMVMQEVYYHGANYGRSLIGKGKTIVIDYCSTNIAKPFHIGHLPTTVIGNALYNIYKFLGYDCVGINHLGDWGTQFGKLIVAYKKWGSKEAIEKGPIRELVKIYVRFHEEAEKNDILNQEARAAFKKIEDGGEESVLLWKWFKESSIKEFKRVLKRLKVDFDSWDGESFFIDQMESVVDELKNKELLEESLGAYIVNLAAYSMPPCIILRSDGATLYATRDLAAIFHRKRKYDFHKVLYCVATQQNLHFQQIFNVVELMGYDWYDMLIHVANGMISLEEGSMSTRKGTVVYLDDVLNEAISKALNIIEERNPQLEGKNEVAEQIGIGAVKFSALK